MRRKRKLKWPKAPVYTRIKAHAQPQRRCLPRKVLRSHRTSSHADWCFPTTWSQSVKSGRGDSLSSTQYARREYYISKGNQENNASTTKWEYQ